ncbi:protein FAR1-RELATED SEQUENCE 5-like [Rosa chinensis]|uniref:protein FAR1-RELATED SEQUENCE 5-like n=1 Tax=Rosa chinensis TaxID=74649 RepID=UPI000D08A28E|nr:protein FAR1-RELATED SEQUENCE 5-like [Rosa chinensis]
MANAVKLVFPNACHRLCTWHIAKNAGKRIGSYLGNPEFKKQFNHCLHGCTTEIEFQVSWDDLISRYNVGDNTWLTKLYSLKEKWCPAFSRDIFSAKIRSTQRSESTNNVFHQISTNIMELIEFVHHYEKKIEEMRLAELEDDYRCKNGAPRPKVWSKMLRSAAKVFDTNNITSLPTQYVLKRWTKEAKKGIVVSNDTGGGTSENSKSARVLRLSELMHEGNNVYDIASLTSSGTKIVKDLLTEAMKRLEKDKDTLHVSLMQYKKEHSVRIEDMFGTNFD